MENEQTMTLGFTTFNKGVIMAQQLPNFQRFGSEVVNIFVQTIHDNTYIVNNVNDPPIKENVNEVFCVVIYNDIDTDGVVVVIISQFEVLNAEVFKPPVFPLGRIAEYIIDANASNRTIFDHIGKTLIDFSSSEDFNPCNIQKFKKDIEKLKIILNAGVRDGRVSVDIRRSSTYSDENGGFKMYQCCCGFLVGRHHRKERCPICNTTVELMNVKNEKEG